MLAAIAMIETVSYEKTDLYWPGLERPTQLPGAPGFLDYFWGRSDRLLWG